LGVVFICSLFSYNNAETSTPFVVAHRGYSSVAPENTIPAFIMAAEAGCEGFELDLLFTKDMQLVVLHDETLDRTTNCTGLLSNYTYAELKDCDASYVDGMDFQKYRGTRIPLFSEALEVAYNFSMFVIMDYKSAIPIGASLNQILANTSMASRVVGSCWYPWQVEDIGTNLPGTPKQFLTSGVNPLQAGFWEQVVGSRVNGFSINHRNISKDFVDQAHSRLLSVAVWTINNATEMEYALSYGVDAIITDDPPTLKQVIHNYNISPPVDDHLLHVHAYAVVISAAVVLVLVAASVGAAVFFYRQNKYTKISS